MHPAQLSHEALIAECSFRNDRRSGPGGQHRNKVETAVIVTHSPTGIRAEANERRSQVDNRRNAIFRLRLNLALQYRPSRMTSGGTEGNSASEQSVTECPVSELWNSRRVGSRIQVSATHDDYPALLSEVIDFLAKSEYSPTAAAIHFGVSASQLVKFLRSFPPAITLVNEQRKMLGLGKLT